LRSSCICGTPAFPACKASSISLARNARSHASPRRRRPARAVLSWTPSCDGWYAWGVARRGHRGFVFAAGACWLPRCTFRRRCAYEPRHVDRMQSNAALPGRG
jgi:hypothetical protein